MNLEKQEAVMGAEFAQLFRHMLGRDADQATLQALGHAFGGLREPMVAATTHLFLSAEFQRRMRENVDELSGVLLHAARQRMVSLLLPVGPGVRRILDIGGANSPLPDMGYLGQFDEYVLVDLPPADRNDLYKHIEVRPGRGMKVLYSDMRDLSALPNESFDFVWSGQSIEHVDRQGGDMVLAEAFRVLAPGGWFCLDTPNRLATSVQMASCGGGYVNPDHRFEYTPDELIEGLVKAGFEIESRKGIVALERTFAQHRFQPEDFVDGAAISDDFAGSYVLFVACRKPRHQLRQ